MVHGCIDEFSRKVFWLRACRSNNDPIISAHFFLNALEENKICLDLLKTDCGMENGMMASMQSFFTMTTALIDMGLFFQIRELRIFGRTTNEHTRRVSQIFSRTWLTPAL